jgi:hypothetical protein
MDNESVADQMNRALYLSPELIGEGEIDPLLVQAFDNVADDAEDYEDAEAARIAPPLPPSPVAKQRPFDPQSTPEFRASLVELIRIIGRRSVAVLGGAGSTNELADWVHGFAMPATVGVARLQLAYNLVQTLRKKPMNDQAVEHWFVTRNDVLGDQLPIECLVLSPPDSLRDSLTKAAATA